MRNFDFKRYSPRPKILLRAFLKERGMKQMCCFVILLLFNEMQMSVRRFSAILDQELTLYAD